MLVVADAEERVREERERRMKGLAMEEEVNKDHRFFIYLSVCLSRDHVSICILVIYLSCGCVKSSFFLLLEFFAFVLLLVCMETDRCSSPSSSLSSFHSFLRVFLAFVSCLFVLCILWRCLLRPFFLACCECEVDKTSRSRSCSSG